ncbi:alpha/beta fold hydrolase [Actinoplanes siamensis]|uniref:Alpha/beta hydrolase n=1 Tax=Actinoplanes siamensis TaxID=1223317 RepID=A0A919TIW3_9ACTN|nr:alpha/beta hydrolase [Actinoplanes siamensis]GIF04178.1 alpha/beta hydrolase [Actinoplanes siamensis]
MRKVVSRDGTAVAYAKAGDGPPLVLLPGAFRDHTVFTYMLPYLTGLTTYCYDRRGRGRSGDAPDYAVEREIEDLVAVIEECGGEAAVFGGSTGAVLALEAAMAGAPISRLTLLEPPYRLPGEQLPDADLATRLTGLVARGRRGDAAALFLAQAAGLDQPGIEAWRNGPMWEQSEAFAHTLAYDAAICGDFRLPAERLARLSVPTLVVSSDSTSAWLAASAAATAAAIPDGHHAVLPGVWHRVPAETIGPAIAAFVLAG